MACDAACDEDLERGAAGEVRGEPAEETAGCFQGGEVLAEDVPCCGGCCFADFVVVVVEGVVEGCYDGEVFFAGAVRFRDAEE